ncbi:SDR family NAD(P)-dependent oxidoreductase [Hyalangium versicolor]|uniref:SDR family NAD(P)-dependent oxidoreductase n=1 Tax=Hyalangium versicolor TaxID=2861190 RepID=UPI001CD025C0|nr:SDR family oxidoreductase [Hyalangium versicolor]
MNDFDFAGKTVVITGSSMGIGEVFARELDAHGAKLVLVARSKDKLQALASQLKSAQVIAEDLATPGAAQRVFDEVNRRGFEVDVLINNAGFGIHGPFMEVPLESQRGQIELNIGALVELTHAFLPMLERRQGGIIQVASVAAYQPTPYFAVYGATKAFVLSFSEALWAEYRDRGVRVVCLSPGATDTQFFARAGEAASGGMKRASPEGVVRIGLEAFQKNRPSAVHGLLNRVSTSLVPLFPRAFVAKLFGRIAAPKQPTLPAPAR